MRELLSDKKGAEKLFSIWWFLMLALTAGAMVSAVVIYYSADVDTKTLESDILGEKIMSCVINENGFVKNGFLNDINGGFFYSNCKLNMAAFGMGSNFYFRVKLFNEAGGLVKESQVGKYSLADDCLNEAGLKAAEYPRCTERTLPVEYLLEDGMIRYGKIEILSVSNQKGGQF